MGVGAGSVAASVVTRCVRFSTPGTYPFHCQIHPYMTGTLAVT
jgi:plastocyanin